MQITNQFLKWKNIRKHIAVFFIYYIFTMAWHAEQISVIILFDYFLTVLLWTSTFYIYNFVILPKFFSARKWRYLFLTFILLLVLFLLLYASEEVLMAFLKNEQMKIPALHVFRYGSFWYVNFVLIALGYHFYGESVQEKQKALIEEQKRLLIESELQATQLKLKNAELENLKAQFNPHFLFNSLWYIYTLVQDTGDKKATKAVELLSDMMRYSMQNRQVNEFVPLENELNYAYNYIELQRLRSPMIKLDYQVNGNVIGVKILPLVMISFIENACKHGKLNEEDNPLVFHITVEGKDKITIFVKNKISLLGKERSSGIGLENVKNRLKTAYGSNFALDITNDGTFYTSLLTIKL